MALKHHCVNMYICSTRCQTFRLFAFCSYLVFIELWLMRKIFPGVFVSFEVTVCILFLANKRNKSKFLLLLRIINLKPDFPWVKPFFYLCSREVWPEGDVFGSQDIFPEEEIQLLKQILSAPLPRESPPFTSVSFQLFSSTNITETQ